MLRRLRYGDVVVFHQPAKTRAYDYEKSDYLSLSKLDIDPDYYANYPQTI